MVLQNVSLWVRINRKIHFEWSFHSFVLPELETCFLFISLVFLFLLVCSYPFVTHLYFESDIFLTCLSFYILRLFFLTFIVSIFPVYKYVWIKLGKLVLLAVVLSSKQGNRLKNFFKFLRWFESLSFDKFSWGFYYRWWHCKVWKPLY